MLCGNRELKDRINELEDKVEYLQQTKQTWILKHASAQEEFYRNYRAVRMEYARKYDQLSVEYDRLYLSAKQIEGENIELRKMISRLESENALHRISSKLGCDDGKKVSE